MTESPEAARSDGRAGRPWPVLILGLLAASALGQPDRSSAVSALESQRMLFRIASVAEAKGETWRAALAWSDALGLETLCAWPGSDLDPKTHAGERVLTLVSRALRSGTGGPPGQACQACDGDGLSECPLCAGAGAPSCPASVACERCGGRGVEGADSIQHDAIAALAEKAVECSAQATPEGAFRAVLQALGPISEALPSPGARAAEPVARLFRRLPVDVDRMPSSERERLKDSWKAANRHGRTEMLLRYGLVLSSLSRSFTWVGGPPPSEAPSKELRPAEVVALALRGGGWARLSATLTERGDHRDADHLVTRGIAETGAGLLRLAVLTDAGVTDLQLLGRQGVVGKGHVPRSEGARRSILATFESAPPGSLVEVTGWVAPCGPYPAPVLVDVLAVKVQRSGPR